MGFLISGEIIASAIVIVEPDCASIKFVSNLVEAVSVPITPIVAFIIGAFKLPDAETTPSPSTVNNTALS